MLLVIIILQCTHSCVRRITEDEDKAKQIVALCTLDKTSSLYAYIMHNDSDAAHFTGKVFATMLHCY